MTVVSDWFSAVMRVFWKRSAVSAVRLSGSRSEDVSVWLVAGVGVVEEEEEEEVVVVVVVVLGVG